MEQMGEIASGTAPMAGSAPGLAGVRGRMRVDVDGKTVGVLVVDDGRVELTNDQGPTDAVFIFHTAQDLRQMVRGELNPVVGALQGRMRTEGNVALAIRVALGLRSGSPFVSK
jgi:hypothetical protein